MMVSAIRDLPMPGSPEISTTEPSPPFARSQRRSSRSISSTRLTSGVVLARSASNRLSAALAPSACHAWMASAKPLSATIPRSRYSNRPPVSLRVLDEITTAPGSASACSRAARFGVSPTTACSWAAPAPSSPTTTSPVAMPTRTCKGAAAAVLSIGTASTSESPVRTARSASCSWAWG